MDAHCWAVWTAVWCSRALQKLWVRFLFWMLGRWMAGSLARRVSKLAQIATKGWRTKKTARDRVPPHTSFTHGVP